MTIKLNYNATETFGSRDLNDLAEPELTYKVWRNPAPGWRDAASRFLDDSRNAELALEVVGLALISVSDGEQTHQIGSVKKAGELQKAVDAANPGYGETYMVLLAIGIIDRQLERQDRLINDLKKSLPDSSDGAAATPLNGKMEQPTPSTATT